VKHLKLHGSILEKRYLLMETHVRSMAKTVSWRIIATLTTMLLVFLFTGNLAITGGVGLTEFLAKTIIYYVHERVWNAIGFGRIKKSNE
jgi:adenylylsulfate kinase